MNSIRIIYRGIHSTPSGGIGATDYVSATVLRVTWPPIHSNSIVLISASECQSDDVQRFTPSFARFVGDASITVRNISPQEGFVDFWIYVDWEEPLPVMVDIVVLDPPEFMVVVDSDFQNQEIFQVDTSPQGVVGTFAQEHLSKAQLKAFQTLVVNASGSLANITTSIKPSRKRRRRRTG